MISSLVGFPMPRGWIAIPIYRDKAVEWLSKVQEALLTLDMVTYSVVINACA